MWTPLDALRRLVHFQKNSETDLAVTERLLPMVPDHVVKVSESGIAEPEDAWRARDAGADAVLCGQALMLAEDPEQFVSAMKEA